MNNDKRQMRIELMNNLYTKDIFEGTGFPFDPVFEHDEARALFPAIVSSLADVDRMIEQALFDYTLSRLSYVDRAIVRLAVYELMFTKTPPQIVIDEAIELTKTYANLDDMKQHRFNNRLLDNVLKLIKG